MKNITKYIGLAFASVLAFSACDKNLEPTFDDKDAFVAFESVSYSVSEDYSEKGEIYKIPVTLASVAGLEATVKFEIGAPESKAAVEGKNFELVTTTGTLSFDAEHRTQYVEFKTISDGEYTGDLSFTITLTGTDEIKVGSEDKCTVTLSDIDHPLGFLFGSYTTSGNDNWDGETSWTTVISKDEKDDHRIWFLNLANDGGNSSLLTYGNVSDDLSTINIPFGQTFTVGSRTVTLYGLTSDQYMYKSGSVDVAIVQDASGKITLDFGDEWGFGYGITEGGSGYYAVIWPGMSSVKN